VQDDLTFRPITVADADFLYEVYASTRKEELAPLDWSEAQKAHFLRMQFEAQHQYYQQEFGDATFEVLLWRGQPIGRLYVLRRTDEIRIIDIAILPAWRQQGIGGALLRDILAEGQATGVPVRIHVEKQNPALRLYERLGFKPLEDHGVYLFLERAPEPAASA
jgi:ribosomal protein S18 acetylase RimI-like enzyme